MTPTPEVAIHPVQKNAGYQQGVVPQVVSLRAYAEWRQRVDEALTGMRNV